MPVRIQLFVVVDTQSISAYQIGDLVLAARRVYHSTFLMFNCMYCCPSVVACLSVLWVFVARPVVFV